MTSLLHHATSWQGSSHFKRVIQLAAFLPRHTHTPVHESQKIPRIPHSWSSFWWSNILHMLVTLYSWICFVSTFFISVLTVSVIISFISHVSHFRMHTATIIKSLTFQMTAWSFRDVELKVKNRFDESILRARLTYGGYSLCGDTDHL